MMDRHHSSHESSGSIASGNINCRHRHSYVQLLAFYMLFGAVHELAHVLAAWLLSLFVTSETFRSSAFEGEGTLPSFWTPCDFEWWFSVLFLRQTPLQLGIGTDEAGHGCPLPSSSPVPSACLLPLVHHAGWISSTLLAWSFVRYRTSSSSFHWSLARFAAIVTALEAISTDLLGLSVIPLFDPMPHSSRGGHYYYNYCCYCGNFGVILIHSAWWNNTFSRKKQRNKNGKWKDALDVLERMVEVTMVRGAQSGGVVSYINGRYHKVRVVNYKRTSLSQLLRVALERKLPVRTTSRDKQLEQQMVVSMSGHTRFATSSKATLDGTHPQQWTPATDWNIWDATAECFLPMKVENYVTHNGDFEYYTFPIRSTVDLSVVQDFLSVVTGTPTPASVDSCAIAGMLDVLRTKGSFALSLRYALCCKYTLLLFV